MDPEFSATVQQVANDLLVWIGFGTLVGLLAKAVMPGRDPGGAVATLLMGIGGTVIGCGTLSFFYDKQRVTPISPIGFLVGTGGAFILLLFYRILGGYLFREGQMPPPPGTRPYYRRSWRRRDRSHLSSYED
ncbi:MAG: GlsB/YeaQ/YmgE family stress response membrane protein [Pirellulales bacterium]|nr:GlsB/YeaQ/YmgE family stress response membrane protein [Pirellulales bacterium]